MKSPIIRISSLLKITALVGLALMVVATMATIAVSMQTAQGQPLPPGSTITTERRPVEPGTPTPLPSPPPITPLPSPPPITPTPSQRSESRPERQPWTYAEPLPKKPFRWYVTSTPWPSPYIYKERLPPDLPYRTQPAGPIVR